jgi:hypothetical protein
MPDKATLNKPSDKRRTPNLEEFRDKVFQGSNKNHFTYVISVRQLRRHYSPWLFMLGAAAQLIGSTIHSDFSGKANRIESEIKKLCVLYIEERYVVFLWAILPPPVDRSYKLDSSTFLQPAPRVLEGTGCHTE